MKLGVLVVFTCLILTGCGDKGEPPLSLGSNDGGTLRSAKLVSKQNGTALYDIEYPAFKLNSQITIDLSTRSIIKEVFADKWVVIYEYKDMVLALSHLPTLISIYTDKGDGAPGESLNVYEYDSIFPSTGGCYLDKNSNQKIIEFSYFNGISGGHSPL